MREFEVVLLALEFLVEISQFRAALIGSRPLFDEAKLEVVEDEELVGAVLPFDCLCSAGDRRVDGDMNSLSSRSPKNSGDTWRISSGKFVGYSFGEFVAASVPVKALAPGGLCSSCSRVGLKSEIEMPCSESSGLSQSM